MLLLKREGLAIRKYFLSFPPEGGGHVPLFFHPSYFILHSFFVSESKQQIVGWALALAKPNRKNQSVGLLFEKATPTCLNPTYKGDCLISKSLDVGWALPTRRVLRMVQDVSNA